MEPTSSFLIGVMIASIWLIILFLIVFILAKSDILFTFVREAEVKIVLEGEEFHTCLIASQEFCFEWEHERGALEVDDFPVNVPVEERARADQWNIRRLRPESDRPIRANLWGIYWVGLPPYRKILTYKQVETIYKQKGSEEGGKVSLVEVTTEEQYDYFPLEERTFVLVVQGAETAENMPVNLKFAVTVQIVNPFKAGFRTDTWLKTTFDQLGPQLRLLTGVLKYEHLNEDYTGNEKILLFLEGADVAVDRTLNGDRINYRKDWITRFGVNIVRVQVQEVEPVGKLAEEFVRASTVQYMERQKAKAEAAKVRILAKAKANEINTIANAEERRINMVYSAIADKKGGETIKLAEAIENTKVQFLTLGSSVSPSIAIPSDKEKDNQTGA